MYVYVAVVFFAMVAVQKAKQAKVTATPAPVDESPKADVRHVHKRRRGEAGGGSKMVTRLVVLYTTCGAACTRVSGVHDMRCGMYTRVC